MSGDKNTQAEHGVVPETKKIFDERQEAVFSIALEKFKNKNFKGKKDAKKSDKDKNESARKTIKDMAKKNSETMKFLAESPKDTVIKLYGEAAGYLWEAAQNTVLKNMEIAENDLTDKKEEEQKAENEKVQSLEKIKNELSEKMNTLGEKFKNHGAEIARLSDEKKKGEMTEKERQIINNFAKMEKSLAKALETLLLAKSEEKAGNVEKTLQRLSEELSQNQEAIRNLATAEVISEKETEIVAPQEDSVLENIPEEKTPVKNEIVDFRKEADLIRGELKELFRNIQKLIQKAKNPETKKIYQEKYLGSGNVFATFELDYSKATDKQSDQVLKERALDRLNKNKDAAKKYLAEVLEAMQNAEKTKEQQIKKPLEKENVVIENPMLPETPTVPEIKETTNIETEILKKEIAAFKNELQKYVSGEKVGEMPTNFVDTAKAYLVLTEKAEEDEERTDFENARAGFLAELKKISDTMIKNSDEVVLPEPEKKGFFGNIWKKSKEIFGKSKEVLKKEEVRDMAAETAYKTATSVLGVKFVTDLVRAIGGKGDIADYYKRKKEESHVAEKFTALLRQSEKNKTTGKENLKEEEKVDFISKARELFYEINKSDRSPKEKQEMKDKLKILVRQYDSEKGNTEKQAQTAVIDIVDDYTKNKVSGVSVAKDFLNTLTTATGTYALRGVVYGAAAATERFLKLKKENARREAGGEVRKGIIREMTVGAFSETLKELNVFDKEKSGAKKAVDFVKASGVLLRVAGIGGLALGELHQEGADIIEKTLENIKKAVDHNVFEKGGALNNFAANFDRLTFGSTGLSEKMSSASEKINSEMLDTGSLLAQEYNVKQEEVDVKFPWEEEKTPLENMLAEEKSAEIPQVDEEIKVDTSIHKGDGYYDVFRRQIEADPEKYGYQDEGDVDDFIERKTREFLKTNDLWKNGKGVGLIYNPEAKIVLNTDGSFEETGVRTYKMEIPKPKLEVSSELSPEENISSKSNTEEIITNNRMFINEAAKKELNGIYTNTVKDVQKDFGEAKAQKLAEKMGLINKKLNELETVVAKHPTEGADNLEGRLKDIKETLLKAQQDDTPANYSNTLRMFDDIKSAIDSDIKIIENQTGDGQVTKVVTSDLTTEEMIAKNEEFIASKKAEMENDATAKMIEKNYENLVKAGEHKEAAMRSLGLSNEEIINKIQAEADAKELAGREIMEREKLAQIKAEEAKIDNAFAQEEVNAKANEIKWQEMQQRLDIERAQSQQEIEEMFKNLQRRYVDDPENLSKLNRQFEKSQSVLEKAALKDDTSPEEVLAQTAKSLDKNNLDFFKKLPHIKEAAAWAKEYSGGGKDKVQEALSDLNQAAKDVNSGDYLRAAKKIEELRNQIEKVEKVGLVGILNKDEIVEEVTAKPIDPSDRVKLDAFRQEAHDAEIKAKEEVARYAAEQEETNRLKEIKTERMKAASQASDNRAIENSLSVAEKQTAKAFEDAYKYLEEKQKEVDFIRSVDAEKESFKLDKEIKELEKLSRALEKANEKGVPLNQDKVNDFVTKVEMIKRNSDNDEALEAIKEAEAYLKKGGKLDKYMEMVKDAVSQVLRGPNG